MNPVQHILIFAVRLYRWTLAPMNTFLSGPLAGCRFTPSCSQYALDALKTHGALAGSWLATKRICRCHPWGDCGHDPVPERKCEGRTPIHREQAAEAEVAAAGFLPAGGPQKPFAPCATAAGSDSNC
jgi:putative membrane protein insertion efficiency factor